MQTGEIYSVEMVVDNCLSVQKKKHRNSFDIDCPFCGRKMKLNVNTVKNKWRCPACDESGDAIGLIMKLKNIDYKNALKAVRVMEAKNIELGTLYDVNSQNADSEYKAVYPGLRNDFYSAFLDQCGLNKSHSLDLKRRGLTKKDVMEFNIKSYPNIKKIPEISKNVMKSCIHSETPQIVFKNKKLGVPGFYDLETDKPMFTKRYGGYLIPVVSFGGYISGLQIHNDKPPKLKEGEKYPKYTWISSINESNTGCSVSSCNPMEKIHHVGFDWSQDSVPEEIILTEGCLKADVAYALSKKKRPIVALIGVSNTAGLSDELKMLKERGCKKITICIDMDFETNKDVRKALRKIEGIISESGIEYKQCLWDSNYKGIDDYLYSLRQKEADVH